MLYQPSSMLNSGLRAVLAVNFHKAFDRNWFENGLVAMGPTRMAETIARGLWMKGISWNDDEFTRELHHQLEALDKNGCWDLKSLTKF